MGEELKPRKRRGCRMYAIVSFLILAVLIAVPGILASGRASNHRNAAAGLKTIPSAEADFRGNDRDDNKVLDYWVGDVSRLYYLEVQGQPIKLIERSVADADGAPNKPLETPRSKVGFKFAALKFDETGAPYDRGGGRNPEKYAFCAYPETYRPKAAWYQSSLDLTQFTYIVNEENVIWKKDLGGAPAVKWPKDPLAEGWSKLD
jgi:hypothetical protein